MTPTPPSAPRVIAILTRTAGRRFLNRLGSIFTRRKKPRLPADGERRTATPGKTGVSLFMLGVSCFIFLPQGIMISSLVVARIANEVTQSAGGSPPRAPIQQHLYLDLKFDGDEQSVKLTLYTDLLLHSEYRAETIPIEEDPRKRYERRFLNERGQKRLEELLEVYRQRGADGFRPVIIAAWPDGSVWPSSHDEPRMLVSLGLFLTMLFFSLFLSTLGSANQDLGRVEWSFEWLFSFPVKARMLFVARILEHTFVNAISWFTCFPFAFTVFWSAGRRWWALPLAAATTLYLNVLLASVRVVTETWLRKNLTLARLKNLQAVLTMAGLLAFYAVLYLGISKELPGWFVSACRTAPAEAMLWLPTAFPVQLASESSPASIRLIGMLLAGGGVFAAAAFACERIVRDGLLITSGGAYQGKRQRTGVPGARARAFRGILGKEVLLLCRDRNFLVQTLVVPIVIIGFQVFINPALLQAGSRDPRHGAMIAFGIGAYVLMFGGFSILSVEGHTLWLLYTFPRPLISILRQKAKLWAAVSALYVVSILAVLGFRGGRLDPSFAASSLMAMVGVVIYAYIACGMGVLGTNPLEQELQRKTRPGMMYLYMLLASLFAYGIYSPALWNKIALLVLCSLLAYAIWQKARDRLPYLLDPTESPPPRIGLSDGLIAALAFFTLQGFVLIILGVASAAGSKEELLSGGMVTIAFVTAGAIVVLFALFFFWRAGVPDLLVTLGLRGEGYSWFRISRAALTGSLCGLIAATFGILYLHLVDFIPPLKQLKDESFDLLGVADTETWWWLAALAVLAAPPLEEFIFRGLVFRGLRRSLPAATSILASAAIFAVVHPPLSFLPVLGLGVAAAFSFERTGLLAAPITAHMVYNAVMLLANKP